MHIITPISIGRADLEDLRAKIRGELADAERRVEEARVDCLITERTLASALRCVEDTRELLGELEEVDHSPSAGP